MSESEDVSNEELRSVAAQMRPAFKIGFQRRKRFYTTVSENELERAREKRQEPKPRITVVSN